MAEREALQRTRAGLDERASERATRYPPSALEHFFFLSIDTPTYIKQASKQRGLDSGKDTNGHDELGLDQRRHTGMNIRHHHFPPRGGTSFTTYEYMTGQGWVGYLAFTMVLDWFFKGVWTI